VSAPGLMEALMTLRELEGRFRVVREWAHGIYGDHIPPEIDEEIDQIAARVAEARKDLNQARRVEAKAREERGRYLVAADCTDEGRF